MQGSDHVHEDQLDFDWLIVYQQSVSNRLEIGQQSVKSLKDQHSEFTDSSY
jgi:hypothetical protein